MNYLKFMRHLFLLVTLHGVSVVHSEFRFCFHGPHKFSFEDCPGGVFFKAPVPTTCSIYIKSSSMGDGRATVNGDICDGSISEDADLTEANPMHPFSVTKVQEVTYDGDPNSATNGVDPSTVSDCTSTCFKDWMDPDYIIPPGGPNQENFQEFEQGYKYPTLDDGMKAEQASISEQLFMKLLLNEDINDGGTELRVAKLLRASFIVLNGYCPEPYVSLALLNKTLDSFLFFTQKGNETIKDIGVREFRLLMNVLAQCRIYDKHSAFQIIGKNCSETPLISAGLFETPGQDDVVVPNYPKKMKKLDPFIEASWQAISFINAQCFKYFKDEFNLHHIYEVAMESLFTELVLLRWANPPALKNPSFWNNLLGSSNFEAELGNINACVRYAYYRNPYTRRLERPFKQVNGSDPDTVDDNLGWQGTEQEYWDQYKTKGGFQAVAPKLGAYCFQTESDRLDAVSAAQAECH